MKINIPNSTNNGTSSFDIEAGLVVIGANGAGKTRFGSKVEQLNTNSRRISAQRMLHYSDSIQKQEFEEAIKTFLQGYKNQSPITQQNDFQQLLVSIFSEESKRDSDYVKEARKAEAKPPIPDSIIDKIIKVWDRVFPHRKILFENNKIKAKEPADAATAYPGTEMSDGEKVGLYLIAQVLLSSNNTLLIIDEPELHLHKALMVRLWNTLESFRSDCQFIYITHDLDFAVNKSLSQKIWIRNYQNNVWTWEFIEGNGILPETLYIEVAGSRRPVIFVEGDKGSLDYKVYQMIYSDFTIIPVGSCTKVIEVVKGFRTANYLHDIKVCGIVDRDFRSPQELVALENDKIFNTEYSEIENVFLYPEITDFVSGLLVKDAIASREQIKHIVKKRIEDQIALLTFNKLQSEIIYVLQGQIYSSTNVESIFDALTNVIKQKETMIEKCRKSFEEAKDSDDINKMLNIFPEKGLSNQIAPIFDMGNLSSKPYTSLLLRKLNADPTVKDLFKSKLPEIREGNI